MKTKSLIIAGRANFLFVVFLVFILTDGFETVHSTIGSFGAEVVMLLLFLAELALALVAFIYSLKAVSENEKQRFVYLNLLLSMLFLFVSFVYDLMLVFA